MGTREAVRIHEQSNKKGGSNYSLDYLSREMKSYPAIHPHTPFQAKVCLSRLPTFQRLSYLERKKKFINTPALLLFVLMPHFTKGPFNSQKPAKVPGE